MVGCGTQNRLLCQFAADATGKQVVAGPVEATAVGSILMQAMALGYISSLEEGRNIVSRSFKVVTYASKQTSEWENAYQKYLKLKG